MKTSTDGLLKDKVLTGAMVFPFCHLVLLGVDKAFEPSKGFGQLFKENWKWHLFLTTSVSLAFGIYDYYKDKKQIEANKEYMKSLGLTEVKNLPKDFYEKAKYEGKIDFDNLVLNPNGTINLRESMGKVNQPVSEIQK